MADERTALQNGMKVGLGLAAATMDTFVRLLPAGLLVIPQHDIDARVGDQRADQGDRVGLTALEDPLGPSRPVERRERRNGHAVFCEADGAARVVARQGNLRADQLGVGLCLRIQLVAQVACDGEGWIACAGLDIDAGGPVE